jgi:Spy/CpxP family protein refolding chaperone
MRKRIAQTLLVVSVASAFGAMPAVSSAKHGADDPAGHHHHHHKHHLDDGPRHR